MTPEGHLPCCGHHDGLLLFPDRQEQWVSALYPVNAITDGDANLVRNLAVSEQTDARQDRWGPTWWCSAWGRRKLRKQGDLSKSKTMALKTL